MTKIIYTNLRTGYVYEEEDSTVDYNATVDEFKTETNEGFSTPWAVLLVGEKFTIFSRLIHADGYQTATIVDA